MPAIPEHEIYAMKYAERQADLSTFMLGVEPGRETITIDYFVWLLQGGSEPIVVDTGFTPQIAEARKRKYLASPADQLRKLGVDPADVKKVLIPICIGITLAASASSPMRLFICRPRNISTGQVPSCASGRRKDWLRPMTWPSWCA